MGYLVDTNVWLELLLEQERAGEARGFLGGVDSSQLALTDFSLHSIGIALTRLGKDGAFLDFLADTIEDSGVERVRLGPVELGQIPGVMRRFGVDFDDAVQYVAAQSSRRTLVSFDRDFDRTDIGRKTPADALKAI